MKFYMIIIPDGLLKFLSSAVIVILAFLLNKFFYNRPRLIAYYGHFTGHLLKKCDPNIPIFTHSVVIRNLGKLTATNVRLGHKKRIDLQVNPLDFPEISIVPEVMYTKNDLPDGGKEILFPTVVPNKQITISYLYFHLNHMNFNTYVECDEGAAEIINTIPARNLSTWAKGILWSLIFIGATTVLYFALLALLHI
jgi:hypothetical protein